MPDESTLDRLKQELQQVQTDVKGLDSQRERLLREASVEEHKVKESLAKLTELGVTAADKMSVEELMLLRSNTRAELEKNLETAKRLITEAQGVMTQYDTAVQA